MDGWKEEFQEFVDGWIEEFQEFVDGWIDGNIPRIGWMD